jgi:AAA15 family ATPase/GTPase
LGETLPRVYLDNYKCFVDFEYRPGRKQLILGENGSGKSSFLDALMLIRDFTLRGDRTETFFPTSHRTRWVQNPRQTIEIEAALRDGTYVLRLAVEPWGAPPPTGR